MGIPKNRWKDIAFSGMFRYLHVIKEGHVDIVQGHSSTVIMPTGYDVAMYRVSQDNTIGGDSSEHIPVVGYFSTGSDARIIPGQGLVITSYASGSPDPNPPTIRFKYLIYGGDYSDD